MFWHNSRSTRRGSSESIANPQAPSSNQQKIFTEKRLDFGRKRLPWRALVAAVLIALVSVAGLLRYPVPATAGIVGGRFGAAGKAIAPSQAQPEDAVVLNSDLSSNGVVVFKFGQVIPLNAILGGKVANPDMCLTRHLHHDPTDPFSGIRICTNPFPFQDSSPSACGYGPVVKFESDIELILTPNPIPPVVGKKLTFELTATNKGQLKVDLAKIKSEVLFSGAKLDDSMLTFEGCGNASPSSEFCELRSLGIGESRKVMVSFTPLVNFEVKGTFTATGFNEACGARGFPDPNPDNNTAIGFRTVVPEIPAPDFTIEFEPSTVTVTPGTKTKVRIKIIRSGGFQGAVTITPPENPTEGIKPLPDGEPITTTEDTAVFKYKVGKGVEEGQYSLTFTATDGVFGGKTHTGTVIIKVVD